MSSVLCLAQLVAGTSGNNVLLVLQIVFQNLLEVQDTRLAVNQRQHNDTKGALQSGMLVQTVQNNVRNSITLQLNNNLHAVFKAGEVVNLGNAFDYAVLSQVSNILNQVSFVNLIWDFGNNDMVLALVGRHNFSLGADFYNATAGVISTGNTFLAQNAGTGREVRAFDSRHQLWNFHIRVINQHNKAVNNLAQIVRRNVGSHTYSDTGTAVNQQSRDLRRKYAGLL